MNWLNPHKTVSLIFLGLLIFSGCTDNLLRSKVKSKASLAALSGTNPSLPTLVFSRVEVVAPPQITQSNNAPRIRLWVDSSQSTGTGACSTGNRLCACLYSWQEINTTSGISRAVPRSQVIPMTSSDGQTIECPGPANYYSEIDPSTKIQASAVGIGTNQGTFTSTPIEFTPSGKKVSGTFQDFDGNGFENIHRYTCYERFNRGTKIISKKDFDEGNAAKPQPITWSTQFCFYRLTQDSLDSNCSTSSQSVQDPNSITDDRISSQSYGYHFYLPGSRIGSLSNSWGQTSATGQPGPYICPKVDNGLGGEASLYPLDSSFSLAVTPSAHYPIGVEAWSHLQGMDTSQTPGDTSTNSSACFPGKTTQPTQPEGQSSTSGALVKSCLGFAAKPIESPYTQAGTCPSLKDADGKPMRTYRLRRFVLMNPVQWNTDGRLVPGLKPSIDVVYSLDRPVRGTGLTDPDGNEIEYTIEGPKPCPYAFFDNKGITGNCPGGGCYVGVNNPAWSGKDVDGLTLPNFDYKDFNGSYTQYSCSTSLLLYDWNRNTWSLGTVHPSNPRIDMKSVSLRPFQAFVPRYEEDTSFQACAPQPKAVSGDFPHQAPLEVLKKADNSYAWCEKTLPTKNSYAIGANKQQAPSTRDPQATERAILADDIFNAYFRYSPLQAPTSDIVRGLKDSRANYDCRYTWRGNLTGAGKDSPSSGCCSLGIPANGIHLEAPENSCNHAHE